MRRWTPLLVAMLAAAVAAGGPAVASPRLAAPASGPPPTLRSVPAVTLAQSGITLAAAGQPPYCGVAVDLARVGWLRAASSGCAVGRDRAEAAARLGSPGTVVESLLARASGPAPLGRDRLVWLVVMRGGPLGRPMIACLQPAGGPALPCPLPPPWGGGTSTHVVLVDAFSGQVVESVPPLVVPAVVPQAGAASRSAR
jgi:hypothetical protein